MFDYIHIKIHALLCRNFFSYKSSFTLLLKKEIRKNPGFDLKIVPSRLKEGLQSLQRKSHRVKRPAVTPHLPFSDIGPAFTDSFTVFTLENSQRSSCSLVYNCVCSFKCEAENVSLGASSVVP